MSEHPILFNSKMVRAILDGRKTQTRRVIKPQPANGNNYCMYGNKKDLQLLGNLGIKCPYGVVGDRLGVQEGYKINSSHQLGEVETVRGYYLADDIRFVAKLTKAESDKWNARKFPFRRTSGRFMYKSLARIWLEITGIRVERVQEISVEDIVAEGLFASSSMDYIAVWTDLWDSINAKRGYGWAKNSFVWVIEFKICPTGRHRR